jgi:hypothetical protein
LGSKLKDESISFDNITFVYNGNSYESVPLFKTYLALLNLYTGGIVIHDCYPLSFSISLESNDSMLKFISSFKETQAVINRFVSNYQHIKNTIFSMKKISINDSLMLEFSLLVNPEIVISFIKFLQDYYKPSFNLVLVNPLCESIG